MRLCFYVCYTFACARAPLCRQKYARVEKVTFENSFTQLKALYFMQEYDNASVSLGALQLRSILFSDMYAKLNIRVPPGLLIGAIRFIEL